VYSPTLSKTNGKLSPGFIILKTKLPSIVGLLFSTIPDVTVSGAVSSLTLVTMLMVLEVLEFANGTLHIIRLVKLFIRRKLCSNYYLHCS
jgi:uncharacterized membrane protein